MVIAIGIVVLLAALTLSATVVVLRKSEERRTENVLRLLDLAVQEWETEADRKLTWGVQDDPYTGVRYDMYNGTPHVYTVTEVLRVIRRSDAARQVIAQIAPEYVFRYKFNGDPDEPVPPWVSLGMPDDPDPAATGGQVQEVFDTNDLGGEAEPRQLAWTAPSGRTEGELAILDAWGTPIRAVHPGRVADPAFDDPTTDPELTDADGTIFVNRRQDPSSGENLYGVESIYGRAEGRRVLFVSAGPDKRFGDLQIGAAPASIVEALYDQAHDNVYSYNVDYFHDE